MKTDSAPQGATSYYEARQKVYAREIKGRFQRLRTLAVFALLGLYYVLPWVQWGDRQALLFDLPARKFYIFNLTFWPQDFYLMAGLLIFYFQTQQNFKEIAQKLAAIDEPKPVVHSTEAVKLELAKHRDILFVLEADLTKTKREVLTEEENFATFDGAPTGDHTIGVRVLVKTSSVSTVASQQIQFMKTVWVQQNCQAFASEQLAFFVLALDRAG